MARSEKTTVGQVMSWLIAIMCGAVVWLVVSINAGWPIPDAVQTSVMVVLVVAAICAVVLAVAYERRNRG